MDKPKYISAGEVLSAHDLWTEVIVGNAEGKVIHRQVGNLFGEAGIIVNLNQAGVPDPDFRWKDFSHKWTCLPFNNCNTVLYCHAFVIDKRDNQKVAWDLVETAAINADIPITPANMEQQPFYRHITPQDLNPFHPYPLTDFGVEWAKDGKDVVLYIAARCHLNGMWWFWSFRSQA
jgi:hypothetical protein